MRCLHPDFEENKLKQNKKMKKNARFFEVKGMIKLLFIPFMFNSFTGTYGQQDDNIKRPVQITLVTPMGTNGLQSPQVTNVFSLNLLAGYAGGLHGLEIGGFSNSVKGDVQGLQIAGFANTVKGNTKGAQIAGFTNVAALNANAFQISGFANIAGGDAIGLQIAGFANTVKGKAKGAQVAGFANISASDAKTGQIAGFANVSGGNVKGAQIAGCVNYAQREVDGLQLGVVNISKNLKGLQFGVVNIADSVEKGIAFGVFNFVKSGYKAFELGGSETIHAIFSFKTGTYKFYNIFSIGSIIGKNPAWAYGYGFGTLIYLNPKTGIAIEMQGFNINEKDIWDTLNMICKIGSTFSYHLDEKISVFGGVTWNVAISELKNSEGTVVSSSLIPWHSFNKTYNNTNVKQYAGFSFGLRIKI